MCDVRTCFRFGLYDQRRVGESIVPSPDSRLVVTTDSFGRIILIETRTGVAVRMWKGKAFLTVILLIRHDDSYGISSHLSLF